MSTSYPSSSSSAAVSGVQSTSTPVGTSSGSVSSTSDIERRSDDVIGLMQDLSKTMNTATEEIYEINARTKLLALNAKLCP